MYLTICDTKQVQSYIFNSNQLKENIGASFLVAQATSTWVADALPPKNNMRADGTINDALNIEADNLEAEVLYCGGGNALILFQDEALSKAFARRLSTFVTERAPGLIILIMGVPVNATDSLAARLQDLYQLLGRASRFRHHPAPLSSLSVTAHSDKAGSPAVSEDDDGPLRDAESLAKLGVAGSSAKTSPVENWLLKKVPLPDSKYVYPRDLDNLGRSSGDFSYIAVIHADGDSIGERLIKLSTSLSSPTQNRELIASLRKFSSVLNRASCNALEKATKDLMDHLDLIEQKLLRIPRTISFELAKEDHTDRVFLPVRPLIVGGDDITVVCNAVFAHSFCAALSRYFEEETKGLPDGRGHASISAGIAIVKSHFPFSRAYLLAGELLRSAKQQKKRDASACSYLDWHFAQSGILRSLSEIRNREYSSVEGLLCVRPVRMADGPNLGHWEYVDRCVREFQNDKWISKRNKLKSLRESLRAGKSAVEDFRERFLDGGDKLPLIDSSAPELSETGWRGDKCGYFDALELVDFLIPFGERSS